MVKVVRNYWLSGCYTLAKTGDKLLLLADGGKVVREYDTITDLITYANKEIIIKKKDSRIMVQI
ncbi:hypothetical protein [Clostridium felsineum]|uniref:Uncharacterized protein n=1 Tax=Clostridium felsineum TaxID=36839 RepID=A0A1S8L530_9CLOT|nr:hypothetical protein [Clostridium felsineum]URZ06791.1 hypothetical protein CLROS_021240 [Clostridium felsineum]URZ11823.1 hypothetical protein CROST_025400 [Clostridium felsineum]